VSLRIADIRYLGAIGRSSAATNAC